MRSVNIFGAGTLSRYTNKIFQQGFELNGWKICEDNSDLTIYQIHGAEKAEAEDQGLIQRLSDDLNSGKSEIIVLLHRPDEIQDRFPKLKETLSQAKRRFGLVFFGKWHLDDPFFNSEKAIRIIIPHGFFDFEPLAQGNPIVIGSNTT